MTLRGRWNQGLAEVLTAVRALFDPKMGRLAVDIGRRPGGRMTHRRREPGRNSAILTRRGGDIGAMTMRPGLAADRADGATPGDHDGM